MAKPKQQPFDKALSGSGMNQRELVQRNPATAFGMGPAAAPGKGGHNSTAPGVAKTTPTSVKYKGRKITAQSDVERVKQGKSTAPVMATPKVKKVNLRND